MRAFSISALDEQFESPVIAMTLCRRSDSRDAPNRRNDFQPTLARIMKPLLNNLASWNVTVTHSATRSLLGTLRGHSLLESP